MSEFIVHLRGQGTAEVAAYGMADAEDRVEKEITRLWPEARVEITGVARPDDAGRIVEEFRVTYRVSAALPVTAATRDEAPGVAFRHARGLLAGSRYQRTAWETREVT